MRLLLITFGFFLAAGGSIAVAQSVYQTQDPVLRGGLTVTGGQQITVQSCTAIEALRTTRCMWVEKMAGVSLDVDFTDADASAASLNIQCYSSRFGDCAFPRAMPVITATATTGISTIKPSIYSWVSAAGTAPGSSNFTISISNVPAPFMRCIFTCGAGAGAADTINVFARGTTP